MINRVAFNVFLLFLALYVFTVSGLGYNTDSGHERIQLVKSIVDRHELSLSGDADLKGIDGKLYPLRGIAPALLSVPFFILGKLFGISGAEGPVALVNQLSGAAAVAVVFLFSSSLGCSLKASLLTAFIYGLGTFAWPYSKISFEHNVETFFVLSSVYCMYRYSIYGGIRNILFSGISFGLAFNTRYTSVLILPALFLMMMVHYLKRYDVRTTVKYIARDSGLFLLAFLPFACLSMWYNFARFGSFFETGYTVQARRLGLDFFGGTPLLTGLAGLLASPGKGFFYYSPVAALFFFSIGILLRKHRGPGACFISIILPYLLFFSKNIYWHGDWSWGPRYLLVLTPFFIIPAGFLLDSALWGKNKFMRGAVYLLVAVSCIIQLAAVSVDFNKYFFHLIIDEKVVFTEVEAKGAVPIYEPPPERYFEWRKSPLLAQFKFIGRIASEIKEYHYVEPREDVAFAERIKSSPFMHIFDFWWLYQYEITGSHSGFIAAGALLLLVAYQGRKLLKAVNEAEDVYNI